MGPPAEPSGVGTPDLGWQQSGRRGRPTAARISTTSAKTPAGAQASPQHGSPTVVSTSSAQSGLPTPSQYDPYTKPDPPNPLQEQMTALAAQLAALTAAVMAGQRGLAVGGRSKHPKPAAFAAVDRRDAAGRTRCAACTTNACATAAAHASGSAATSAGGPANANAARRRAPLRAQRAGLLRYPLRMYEYNNHNEPLFSGAVGAAQHINITTLFSGVCTVIRHLI